MIKKIISYRDKNNEHEKDNSELYELTVPIIDTVSAEKSHK